jgi:hypothetical protein
MHKILVVYQNSWFYHFSLQEVVYGRSFLAARFYFWGLLGLSLWLGSPANAGFRYWCIKIVGDL